METKIKEIVERLEQLENSIAEMRQEISMVSKYLNLHVASDKTVDLLEQGRRNKEMQRKIFARVMQEMGIELQKPIGARKLQQLMIHQGINPEDNEFSRGIIAMREGKEN